MKFYSWFNGLLIVVLSLIISCGKKNKNNNNNNNNPPVLCNLNMSEIVANDTTYNITSDTCYATMNNTFYTEHQVSVGQGCSAEFEGTVFPVAGTYTITSVFNEVIPGSGKVYIQYYVNGKSYDAQSGTVTITGSGTSSVLEFCKVKFRESFGEEKTVSLKSDSE